VIEVFGVEATAVIRGELAACGFTDVSPVKAG
jgi:hypothetical protein